MASEPYRHPLTLSRDEAQRKARDFALLMAARRTVRDFSSQPIPEGVLEWCLEVAGSAPSGANQQPWHFAVVTDPETKREIRRAAEAEERAFYQSRAPQEWLDVLAPLGTDDHKPFLEIAPALVAIFAQNYTVDGQGQKIKNYYVTESVGIATGMLITALHQCGLCSLTHTPSPMKFLGQILGRPISERAFLLLVVGYPAEGTQVPRIRRKALDEIASFHGSTL